MKNLWWKVLFAFLIIFRIAGPLVSLVVLIAWFIYVAIMHHKNKPK